ncbi:hypothetical protein Taro_006665 [Colocasia esculenta]|uniref:Uncharacterized protein n=1 Tax=Colocasia esculenta TaxID=4460 RepID=A0A843TWP5_COLES|nr:hypothetical protein [Colocasia esculenta]
MEAVKPVVEARSLLLPGGLRIPKWTFASALLVVDASLVSFIIAYMTSDGGSYSGSRPRRQHITAQQTFPTHSASEGSAAAASTVGSTTSVADLGSRTLTSGPLQSIQISALAVGIRPPAVADLRRNPVPPVGFQRR